MNITTKAIAIYVRSIQRDFHGDNRSLMEHGRAKMIMLARNSTSYLYATRGADLTLYDALSSVTLTASYCFMT